LDIIAYLFNLILILRRVFFIFIFDQVFYLFNWHTYIARVILEDPISIIILLSILLLIGYIHIRV